MMTVRTVTSTEGKCSVSIPEFSVSEEDPKRAASCMRTMNDFYLKLQNGIVSFVSSRDGQGTFRVRGVDGSFEWEQTGECAFRIKYVIRGRFQSSDSPGQNSVFRLSRVIETEWSDGSVASISIT
jgi:hypothetical protein